MASKTTPGNPDDRARIIEAELIFLRLAMIFGELREELDRDVDEISIYHAKGYIEDGFNTVLEFFEGEKHEREKRSID